MTINNIKNTICTNENNFAINSSWTISLENLYNSINNPLQIINEDIKSTFFGFEIHHSIDNGIDYYDLIDPKSNAILCMNGETCFIVSKNIDCYTLICFANETLIPFQLMHNELSIAGFFECIQDELNPEDIKLYYDYKNNKIVTSSYFIEEYKNKLRDWCISNDNIISYEDWLYDILNNGNNYEEINIPKNASLACSTCKYYSSNGCTNDVRLAYDYYSASYDEKENILNGEFCKYYSEQTNNI